MFAAASLNQAVDRVIREVGAGLDTAVPEEYDVLYVGVILNVGDVVRWLIRVGKILYRLLAGGESGAGRRQVGQAEGQRVVAVRRCDVVAVLDQYPLALGVVVDVGDEYGRGRSAEQIRAQSREQVSLVIDGAEHGPVRCGRCRDPIQCVVLSRDNKDVWKKAGGACDQFGRDFPSCAN